MLENPVMQHTSSPNNTRTYYTNCIVHCVSMFNHNFNMRGQSMILPPSVLNQYSQDDPNNPYLRRHHATLECITQALEKFHPNHNEEITISKVPIIMCNIVDKVNIHVLNLPTDIKLVKRQVWRLHYRSLYGNKFKVIPNATSLSHHAIYIQKRHSTTSELVLGRQK